MIDRPARDKLITRLQWIRDGEATLPSLASDPIETEDESVLIISESILQNKVRLPLSYTDDLRKPSPQGQADIERAVLLLRTNREITPPSLPWWERVTVGCLVVFLLGVVTELVAQDRLIPAVALPMHVITLIAGCVLAVRLLISYIAQLASAGAHIFRVRFQHRSLSDLNPASCWPFASPDEMKGARSLMQTENVPS